MSPLIESGNWSDFIPTRLAELTHSTLFSYLCTCKFTVNQYCSLTLPRPCHLSNSIRAVQNRYYKFSFVVILNWLLHLCLLSGVSSPAQTDNFPGWATAVCAVVAGLIVIIFIVCVCKQWKCDGEKKDGDGIRILSPSLKVSVFSDPANVKKQTKNVVGKAKPPEHPPNETEPPEHPPNDTKPPKHPSKWDWTAGTSIQ